MWNKYGLKVLAVLTALVMVVSCTAVLYSGTEGGKRGDESGGGKGVISLMPPPFIGVAGAAEAAGGGGGAAATGTNFLEEEAGISAYVNVGQGIDLEKAKTAFKSIETANESYIIGEINLTGLPEYVDPHAYVHKDGWIVAYYSKYAPASKIMEWEGYDGGEITTTTLEDAIHQICTAIQFPFATIKGDIEYYDFEYPNANRMMLITDMVSGYGSQSDSFNFEIPAECYLYEGSWSHYASGLYYSSRIKIDGNTVNEISVGYDEFIIRYGEFTSKQLEADVLHNVLVEHESGSPKGISGVATTLIYRTL